jgi:hypothetical protein
MPVALGFIFGRKDPNVVKLAPDFYKRKLWTPAYTPGDAQTSWVYSSNPVLHLYISCYVTVNKPVLSYLLLCLLPQNLQTMLSNDVPSTKISYKSECHYTCSLKLAISLICDELNSRDNSVYLSSNLKLHYQYIGNSRKML